MFWSPWYLPTSILDPLQKDTDISLWHRQLIRGLIASWVNGAYRLFLSCAALFTFVLSLIKLGFSKVIQSAISQDILAIHLPILRLDTRLLSMKDRCDGAHSSSSVFSVLSASSSSGLPHCSSYAISLIVNSGFLLSYPERLSVLTSREP